MNSRLLVLAAVLSTPLLAGAADELTLHTFKKIQLSDQFWCEGASFGDFNRDGVNDIVSGPWWYEGPGFTNKHELYAPTKEVYLTQPGAAAALASKV